MKQTIINVNTPSLAIQYDKTLEQTFGNTEVIISIDDIGNEPTSDNLITIDYPPEVTVRPNSFTLNPGESKKVSIYGGFDLDSLDGLFNFNLNIKSEFAIDKVFPVTMDIAEKTGQGNNPVMEYKLKYFIQRSNYTLNIYQNVDATSLINPVEINGTVDLSYQDRNDLFSPIISKNLSLNLEASSDRDLQDLYSEDQYSYKVELIRNGKIEFLGFLLPDNIWEDFVSDRWILKITATDSLPSLKNMAFSDENKQNFRGRITPISVFNLCLKKTGLELPINVCCQISYATVFTNPFDSVYVSTERYTQNDKEPMDCESILKSTLQCFNCTLLQHNGEWYIFKATDILSDKAIFVKFINGSYIESFVENLGYSIGSNINNASIFHVNENQQKSISPSVQAFQITYDYGNSKNVLSNGDLMHEGTNGHIPGWTTNYIPGQGTAGYTVGANFGVRASIRSLGNNWPKLIELNQTIIVKEGVMVKLHVTYRNEGLNSLYLPFALGVRNTVNNTTTWFKFQDGSWGATGFVNLISNFRPYQGNVQSNQYEGAGLAVFEIEVRIPHDGELILQFYYQGYSAGNGNFGLKSVKLSATENNVKSKSYIGERTKKKSSNTKQNVTVYNGDSDSDLFVGTIFQVDGETPTKYWKRFSYVFDAYGNYNMVPRNEGSDKELLEITVEENLMINQRPMTVFEGDFQGFIPYLSWFTINSLNIDGNPRLFLFAKYSYSLDNDITKMLAKEIINDLSFSDFTVDIIENYRNEAKVTIKT